MRQRCNALLVLGLLFCGTAAAEAPLVVAVDTSRSLSPQTFAASMAELDAVLAELDQGAPAGLISFDDEPIWHLPLPATVAGIRGALGELAPSGQHTLLNDALFFAAKAMPEGGVVLVVTDGRDENSAVTVEDFARTAVERHVRVLSLATGTSIDERGLRRLALLTDGRYGGRVGARPAQEIGQAIRESLAAVVPTSTPVPTAPPAAAAGGERTEQQSTTPARPVAEDPGQVPWWVVLLALVAGAAVVGWWSSRRRPAAAPADDDTVYPEIPPASSPLDAPLSPTIEIEGDTNPLLETQGSAYDTGEFDLDDIEHEAPPVATFAEQVELDPQVFQKTPIDEALEQTFVLEERYVLTVLEPGSSPRSFYLQPDAIFAVGRAHRVNTLTIEDPTLSGQHFRIVPKEGEYFIVDLDTTNGTLVNGRRVKVRRLQSGDKIRAGEVEFELEISLNRRGLAG